MRRMKASSRVESILYQLLLAEGVHLVLDALLLA